MINNFHEYAKKVLIEKDWDNYFTENNTVWEEGDLVFSGSWESLVDEIAEDYEKEFGDLDNIEIMWLKNYITYAWDNIEGDLGVKMNRAFDEFVEASREL